MKVRKKKNGKYVFDYYQYDHVSKKSVRKRPEFNTRSDAELAMLDHMRRRITGENRTITTYTLHQCFTRWIQWLTTLAAEGKRSQGYIEAVNKCYRNLQKFIPDNINHITKSVIDDYIEYRHAMGRSPKTIKNEYITLTSCLNWAESRDMCRNPIRNYRFPEVVRRLPPLPSPAQIQLVFDALPSEPARRAFYFLIATGCRVGEFIELQATDILPSNMIHIQRAVKGYKGRNKERYIPIPPLPFVLPSHGHLFTNTKAKPWTKYQLRDNIKTACKKAAVPAFTIHTLRHCRITYGLAIGERMYDIMSVTGHRTLSSFQRYIELAKIYNIDTYLPTFSKPTDTKRTPNNNTKTPERPQILRFSKTS